MHVRHESDFQFRPAESWTNLRKHGITFEEAITVFNDPFYGTEPDREHSTPGDERFRTFGYSSRKRILAVIHNEDGNTIRIISRGWQSRLRSDIMKTTEAQEHPAPAKLVRGKYSNLLKEGTNVVVLDPALLADFPDSQSVNDALHAFLSLTEQERSEAFERKQLRDAGHRITGYDPRTGITTELPAPR